MLEEIQNRLNEIEQKYHVRIVYACESGSRAWGFPSADSDFDVRFIYVLQKEKYLSIEDRKDTIDIPVNEVLDINGWDIRKSLRLFCNSNAPLYEWLQSPVVYKQDNSFLEELNGLMTDYFSLRKGLHHYLGMAKNAWADLQAEEVKIKRYFYCIRPLLAARWIADKQEVPPMEFAKLRTLVGNDEWQRAIDELLAIKACATEKTLIRQNAVLHAFIEEQMAYCEQHVPLASSEEPDVEPLNTLFRKSIL